MPSRKIISILIITVAIVAAIIIASNKNLKNVGGEEKLVTVTTQKQNDSSDQRDWKSDLSILPEDQKEFVSAPETLTDQVSRSLMSNYLAMKQSGNLDSASAENLVNQAVEFVEKPFTEKYTSDDLTISQNNSGDVIRKYGDELGQAFLLYKPKHPNQIIYLFSLAIQSQNPSISNDTKEISDNYRDLAAHLSKITIPSSYVSLHLKMINGINNMASISEDIVTPAIDPIKSLRSISFYEENYKNIIGSVQGIRLQILNKDKIIYKQGESGYYFYYGI